MPYALIMAFGVLVASFVFIRFIGEFLINPTRISVKTRDTSATIEQDIVRVPRGANKLDILHDLLVQPEFNKVLIFGRTKHGVEKLSKTLCDRGFRSESIHGNKTQSKRQKALDLFKRDHVQILVATDVAARGLDISGVSLPAATAGTDYTLLVAGTVRISSLAALCSSEAVAMLRPLSAVRSTMPTISRRASPERPASSVVRSMV